VMKKETKMQITIEVTLDDESAKRLAEEANIEQSTIADLVLHTLLVSAQPLKSKEIFVQVSEDDVTKCETIETKWDQQHEEDAFIHRYWVQPIPFPMPQRPRHEHAGESFS